MPCMGPPPAYDAEVEEVTREIMKFLHDKHRVHTDLLGLKIAPALASARIDDYNSLKESIRSLLTHRNYEEF